MNLKELNGSGQNLWVFLTIAIITLLTTGASWFLLEEINKFVKWRRRGHDAFGRYTLTLRVFMLAWLLKKGHMIWIWKSGAWWRILVNSESLVMSPYLFKGRIACDIASKLVCHEKWPQFQDKFQDTNNLSTCEWVWS